VFSRFLVKKLKYSEDIKYKDVAPSSSVARPQLLVKSNGITTRVTIRHLITRPPKITILQRVIGEKSPQNPYEAAVSECVDGEIRRTQLKHAFEVWKLMEKKNYSGKKRPSNLRDFVRKKRKEMKGQDSLQQKIKD